MARTWKRRNYFVKPEVQGKFIFKIFLAALFYCILYAVLLANLSSDSMTITYENSKLQLGRTPIILFKEMLKAQWQFIVSGGLGIVIFGLFISHRYAGPLYKFEKSLNSMIKGDHSFTIQLRPHDKGQELAVLINQLNSKLSDDIQEMSVTAETLSNNLSNLATSSKEATQSNIEIAASLANRLKDILHKYKIRA
ncbi:MAG: hypothetical protein WC156_16555 [Pedobacter sp.]